MTSGAPVPRGVPKCLDEHPLLATPKTAAAGSSSPAGLPAGPRAP